MQYNIKNSQKIINNNPIPSYQNNLKNPADDDYASIMEANTSSSTDIAQLYEEQFHEGFADDWMEEYGYDPDNNETNKAEETEKENNKESYSEELEELFPEGFADGWMEEYGYNPKETEVTEETEKENDKKSYSEELEEQFPEGFADGWMEEYGYNPKETEVTEVPKEEDQSSGTKVTEETKPPTEFEQLNTTTPPSTGENTQGDNNISNNITDNDETYINTAAELFALKNTSMQKFIAEFYDDKNGKIKYSSREELLKLNTIYKNLYGESIEETINHLSIISSSSPESGYNMRQKQIMLSTLFETLSNPNREELEDDDIEDYANSLRNLDLDNKEDCKDFIAIIYSIDSADAKNVINELTDNNPDKKDDLKDKISNSSIYFVKDYLDELCDNNTIESDSFDPENNFTKSTEGILAAKLFNAMYGNGTDNKAVIDSLAGLTPEELKNVSDMYNKLYSKTNDGKTLSEVIKSDFSFELEGILMGMFEGIENNKNLNKTGCGAYFKNHEVYKLTEELHDAVSGWGTDEETITKILYSINTAQLKELAKVYEEKYGISLKDDILGDLGNKYSKQIIEGRLNHCNLEDEEATEEETEKSSNNSN